MRRASLAALCISALLGPAVGHADAVPLPPSDCPEGTSGASDHNCGYCAARACTADADCGGDGTLRCVERDLCESSVNCFSMTGSFTRADLRECEGCAGPCEAVRVCAAAGPSTTSAGCGCRAVGTRRDAGGLAALVLVAIAFAASGSRSRR